MLKRQSIFQPPPGQAPSPLQSPVSTKTTEHVHVPPDAIWSVVLHLNRIFESLRRVITVTTQEGGFVKVEFIKET